MPANIYLVLNGNSIDDSRGIMGTNTSLDHFGIEYKDKLFNFFYKQNILNDVIVLSGTEHKSKETVSFFKNVKHLDYLNSINFGNFKGKKREQFFNSSVYNDFKNNTFNFKFTNGESYRDVNNRSLNIMFELNKISDFDDVIICAEKSVLQNIYGIFNDIPDYKIPYIDINHELIIKIKQELYNFDSQNYYI